MMTKHRKWADYSDDEESQSSEAYSKDKVSVESLKENSCVELDNSKAGLNLAFKESTSLSKEKAASDFSSLVGVAPSEFDRDKTSSASAAELTISLETKAKTHDALETNVISQEWKRYHREKAEYEKRLESYHNAYPTISAGPSDKVKNTSEFICNEEENTVSRGSAKRWIEQTNPSERDDKQKRCKPNAVPNVVDQKRSNTTSSRQRGLSSNRQQIEKDAHRKGQCRKKAPCSFTQQNSDTDRSSTALMKDLSSVEERVHELARRLTRSRYEQQIYPPFSASAAPFSASAAPFSASAA
eukprot:Filipodium_phascolosomae@DN281_c0_g1_i1.p1